MAVPVDIFVNDESPIPVPVVGAEVGVFGVGTHTLVASATTDGTGKASFSLPGSATPGTSYEVRIYKLGVNFHGLRTIQVLDPALPGFPNKFDATGADSNILPVSGSPYLCCCTGVFVDFKGDPIANKSIRFAAVSDLVSKTPKVWTIPSKMVGPDELEVRTDSNGRVSVNLVRTGEFYVTFGGDDDTVWNIKVPNRDSVNLIDLIHPFPALWAWDPILAPGNAISLAVGAVVQVPLVVTFTDFEQLSLGLEKYFDIINSDGTKVEASYMTNLGTLALRGLAAGSATATPQLKIGITPVRWPIPTPTLPVLNITITP